MTRERDIERVLDAWLGEGATEMPDRLYLAVLDRVDRQPQRLSARLQLRFNTMRPAFRIAAVAAVLLLTFGLGAAVVGGAFDSDAPIPTTQPSLSVAPSPSPSPAAALPVDLAHIWIGGERTVPSLGIAVPTLLTLDLDPAVGLGPNASVQIDPGVSTLISDVTTPSVGHLRFETTSGDSSCDEGAVGEYTYSFSFDGVVLDLNPVEDGCTARAEALAGPWTRSDCKDANDYCLGDIPAGTYVSTFLDVRSTSATDVGARGAYGQLRYTVPDGWANAADWPGAYDLVPSDVYTAPGPTGEPDIWHGIFVRSRPVAEAQDDTCSGAVEPGIERSLDALTAWVVDHPGLLVAPPQDLTIAGHRATMLDVRLDDAWTATCPDVVDGSPLVLLFRSQGTEPDRYEWGVGGPEDRQRLILVELAPDDVVLIGLESTEGQAAFDALIRQAMPIVESIEFPE